MKYLVISEDGSMVQTDKLSEDDFRASEDGLLDIVEYEDGEFMQYWSDGTWGKVDVYVPEPTETD